MSLHLLFLIIYIIHLYVCRERFNSFISTEYEMRNHNKMYISYYIGDSPQRVYSKLSLHGNMPLVSEVHYRSKYSSTANFLNKEQVEIKGDWTYDTIKYNDKCSLTENDNFISNYTFHVADLGLGSLAPYFALAYKYTDESYSLLHRYYQEQVINELSFYIGEKNHNDRGNLTMGYKIENEDKKYKGYCLVDQNQEQWGCNITKISVNNHNFYENSYAVFRSDENRILVPEEVLNFTIDTIFTKYLEEGICSYTTYPLPPTRKYIDCRCSQLNDTFPNITISLGDFNFVLSYKDLFRSFYNACSFIIEYDTNYPEKYIIGNDFFLKYITKFDYANNTISFYSDDHIIQYESNKKYIQIAIAFCFSSTIIGILLGAVKFIYSNKYN